MTSLQRPLLEDRDEEIQEQRDCEGSASTPDAGVANPFPQGSELEGNEANQEEGRSLFSTVADIGTKLLNRTLMPDGEFTLAGVRLVDGVAVVKFLKFVGLTFASIALVHSIVVRFFPDRDHRLNFWQIWVFEGDLVVRDCAVFFVVGRMWKQPHGVDHLAWIGMAALANVYFESQGYVSWMGHSVTMYEMHCVWPWQLWALVALLIPLFASVVIAHVVRAHQEGVFAIKVIELSLCVGFFLSPIVPSPYFHFHHWFAGWFFGMHANLYDVWWSRMTMAYFWGMYINGIAVYGRDPMLTCEYARFVTVDQSCPAMNGGRCQYGEQEVDWQESVSDDGLGHVGIGAWIVNAATLFYNGSLGGIDNHDDNLEPANWRNCSSKGYHP